MFEEGQGPVETATGFADSFVDAAVAKLDAVFGAGYAKENPQALAAYIAACARSFDTLMAAAAAAEEDELFGEALASFEEELPPAPPPRSKGRRR